ncbi:hypothetical protein GN958_ATG04100 [Phytophthora infestans]|uniref:Uncharacterized protein n=1 Tax=Phytophthora infestans TaxID=4787 RepID=A0A8S9V686_PHYIN|nr:hypothetical protein GN958_ATG04100 [Phytophthora infestans]
MYHIDDHRHKQQSRAFAATPLIEDAKRGHYTATINPDLLTLNVFDRRRNPASDVVLAPIVARTYHIDNHRHKQQGRAFAATPLIGDAKRGHYTAPINPDLLALNVFVRRRNPAADVVLAPIVARTYHIDDHRQKQQGRAFAATPLIEDAKRGHYTAPINPDLLTLNVFDRRRNPAADVVLATIVARTYHIDDHRHKQQGRAFAATPLIEEAKRDHYTAPIKPDLLTLNVFGRRRNTAADVVLAPIVARTYHIDNHRHKHQGRAFAATSLIEDAERGHYTALIKPDLLTLNVFDRRRNPASDLVLAPIVARTHKQQGRAFAATPLIEDGKRGHYTAPINPDLLTLNVFDRRRNPAADVVLAPIVARTYHIDDHRQKQQGRAFAANPHIGGAKRGHYAAPINPDLLTLNVFDRRRNPAADVVLAPIVARTYHIDDHRQKQQGRAFAANPLIGGAKRGHYTAPINPDLLALNVCVRRRNPAADVVWPQL